MPELQLKLQPDETPIEIDTLFSPQPARLWLEVGFGGGEHLAELAAAHPDVGLIGCEPYVNGVARCLSLLGDRDNVRVVIDDARLLLKALPPASFEKIFVLFPDPWPKVRHQKRRIVNADTVADMARVLQPGGELRLASDIMDYARSMLFLTLSTGHFDWLAERPADWQERPEDWPPTRYEEKAVRAGRRPAFFRFRRR